MNHSFQSQPRQNKAITLFWEANLHSWLHRLWGWITKREFRLVDLNETLRHSEIKGSYYLGTKSVNIDRIHGTQGKANQFDAEFNPIHEESLSRWLSVANQKLQGRDLEPVELVQVGEVYYVRDGHHRISVSRWLGQSYVDARITVLDIQSRIVM